MKSIPLILSTGIALTSCASFINTHRMQAAQTKLQATRKLQQAGQWDAALEMAERMHSSVAKTIETSPAHKGPHGASVDLRPLLTGWETGPFASLKTALQKHDSKEAGSAFDALRQQCMNCHAVIGKANIPLQELP